jgi:H+/Cl- antiporter ClcA
MTPPAGTPPVDPMALLRSRDYVRLLVLAGLIGVPVSAVAYGFLWLVSELQQALFTDLPEQLGYDAAPSWWPMPVLAVGGVLVALAIQRLPGTGGHSPADGFKPSGAVPPAQLPGIVLAAVATLSFGAVLGPRRRSSRSAAASASSPSAWRRATRRRPPRR